jgi:hypothetical protein
MKEDSLRDRSTIATLETERDGLADEVERLVRNME